MRTAIYGLLLVGVFLSGQNTNSTPAAADPKALAKMEDSLANQFLDIRKGAGLNSNQKPLRVATNGLYGGSERPIQTVGNGSLQIK
jgi:hypothetical protein